MNNIYRERAMLAVALARAAIMEGYRAGVRGHEPEDDDGWDRDYWNVVLIDLPTGQVSWHVHKSDIDLIVSLPTYNGVWDGHSTEEKFRRLRAFKGFL